MTSVLPEEESKAARMKQKLMNDGHVKEETRSFLSFSRENLSISHSDLEQGFNRHRFRPSRNTILSTASLLIALICLGLEAWKFHGSLANTRELEELKRDVESLKHRFLEEDLLDELKAFEEQLYAEESNDDDDDDDPGEADIENADYDSNYDDDLSASHDYSGDYHTPPTHGSRPSDFPESSSTIQPVPSPPDPSSNKALVEFLATIRKVEAKRGQEFEKNVRESHRNIERERFLEEHAKRNGHEEKAKVSNGTRNRRELRIRDSGRSFRLPRNIVSRSIDVIRKRSTTDEELPRILSETTSTFSPIVNRRGGRNQTRRTLASKIRIRENEGDDILRRNQTGSINVWEKHPPKKYYAHARPDAGQPLLSVHQDESTDQIARTNKRLYEGIDDNSGRGFNWRDEREDAPQELTELHKVTQSTDDGRSKQPRRGMTRRHLRVPRQVYAVHYGADSTLFSDGDEHTGNGRARHSNGVFKAWRPSDWVADLGMGRYFTLADGRLTVHESGLYLVYAQIHYLDEHDENGFHLLVNGRPILQCMIYSPGVGHKSRSCFSAQATVLQAGDHLVLKDVGSARYTLFQHDKSFFGLVKLGETRQQQRHQTQPPQ